MVAVEVKGLQPLMRTAGMIQSGVAGLGANSSTLFRQVQMKRLGDYAISVIKQRLNKGIGASGAPMPALSGKTSAVYHNGKFVRQRSGYAGWKSARGLQPVRDLVGTGKVGGHMLDNLSVRVATDSFVRMGFTTRSARAKAIANERRAEWLGFAPQDQELIRRYAAQMFAAQVEVFRRQVQAAKA